MKDDFDISKLKKTKKKRINSRTKGNTFERKVCEILNERFNTTDFCRSPGSGAFATTHKLPEHMQVRGDLITPKNFAWTIECKKGYNKESVASIFNPNSEIRSFITQAESDAEKANKNFMIVFKQDNQNTIVIIKDSYGPIECAIECNLLKMYIDKKRYLMLELEDFLKLEIEWYKK